MFVRSYGFSIKAGHNRVTVADVFSLMASQNGVPDTSKSNERRFYVDDTNDADFVRGLVVTVKDQKAFCELVNASGSFVIKVNNLTGNNKLMEFNFFVVNKRSGLGIYQHYHQSCTPNTFGSYLRSRYASLSDDSREKEIKNLEALGELTKKKEREIKLEHRGALRFALLVHDESLADVLSKFQQIKSFEYEYDAIVPDKVSGVPIGPYVKRMKEKVIFQPNVDSGLLATAIQGTVGIIKPKDGRVSVIDHIDDEDVPLSIRIANIPEHFGEQDHDTVAEKLDQLDVTTFSTHQVVDELIKACSETYKHIFIKSIKP
ncbi:hypothetical protein IXO675_002560 [Xanthomonas oryzae pv. oryzae]|uniref:hypothetical protein n=1 Tax=Xanthomonas oryzae TaxID=347 RepID=UPI000949C59A|nr:hypothetical protein [Xanthomonas oryzae]OLG43509.1 hypothetical protein BXO33_13905 [Xanthomonas oryzae pv. oryzae]OLH64900.1 hypothetical protein DXO200_17240 [Xanthomonas oryzae pv. oryzae]OLH77226.1 hypothetical protein DXO165_16875 [Xanthomonas oryzae pv. oryzae]OLI70836.1 hypothetical protein IXO151_10790 [Xanthomonas oryzae pv. oryzae]OLK95103.1 hypothetical protein IXO812_15475 [Xanthomonas oryzae pv. oryzae]